MKRFSPKAVNEIVDLSINFGPLLSPGESILTPVTTATVLSGTDIAPSGLIYGSATVQGTYAVQRVHNGVTGVTYQLDFAVDTSNGQHFVESAEIEVI